MSTAAFQRQHVTPTTRPSRRRPEVRTLRGPVAHPARLAGPIRELARPTVATRPLLEVSRSAVDRVGVRGWEFTERGYALLVGGIGASATTLAVLVVQAFLAVSNAPLG